MIEGNDNARRYYKMENPHLIPVSNRWPNESGGQIGGSMNDGQLLRKGNYSQYFNGKEV
jgi:hypothetical protein